MFDLVIANGRVVDGTGQRAAFAADIAVRVFPSTVELKLGVAMAILGGPFFLARLMNVRRTVA